MKQMISQRFDSRLKGSHLIDLVQSEEVRLQNVAEYSRIYLIAIDELVREINVIKPVRVWSLYRRPTPLYFFVHRFTKIVFLVPTLVRRRWTFVGFQKRRIKARKA